MLSGIRLPDISQVTALARRNARQASDHSLLNQSSANPLLYISAGRF
jgi:hypothetical protein